MLKNFTRVVQGADSLISSEDAINGYIYIYGIGTTYDTVLYDIARACHVC